jgi:hypothetical protein
MAGEGMVVDGDEVSTLLFANWRLILVPAVVLASAGVNLYNMNMCWYRDLNESLLLASQPAVYEWSDNCAGSPHATWAGFLIALSCGG